MSDSYWICLLFAIYLGEDFKTLSNNHQGCFMGVKRMQLHRTPCPEGPRAWFNTFAVDVLKVLIILFLNLCFVSQVQWDSEACNRAEAIGYNTCVSHLWWSLSHRVFAVSHELWMLVNLDVFRTRRNYKASVSHTQLRLQGRCWLRETTWPIWIRTGLKCRRKIIKGHSNKCKQWRDSTIWVLICVVFLCSPTTCWRWCHRRKRDG